MWLHFVQLFARILHGVPTLLSSNWADKFFGIGLYLAGLVILALNNRHHMRQFWQHKWKNLLLGLVPVIVGYAILFIWSTVQTVYDDHHDAVGRLKYVTNERDQLKALLSNKEVYIKQIEGKQCPSSPSCPAPRHEEASILSGSAQVRAICTLRNFTKMPNDLVMSKSVPPSFLKGAVGTAYLDTLGAVHYQRTEDEGQVSISQSYFLPENSELLNKPVSSLSEYSLLSIGVTGADGAKFSSCSFAEITFRINGKDVFRKTGGVPPSELTPQHSPIIESDFKPGVLQ